MLSLWIDDTSIPRNVVGELATGIRGGALTHLDFNWLRVPGAGAGAADPIADAAAGQRLFSRK